MNEMRNLRILVVLPMYGGSLPIGRYCVNALRRLGHRVEVFEAPEFLSAFNALRGMRVTTDKLEYLENSFLNVVSQAVLARVESSEPDLVLALAQAPLSRQALTKLRRMGVPTAMWFVEDFRLFTYWRAFAPLYDFFAVIQKDEFLRELEAAGVSNALYLPLAADPEVHRPLELGPVETRRYGADVAFLGAGYPNRRRAFHQLVNYDFKIWGTEWDGDSLLAPHVQMGGARISPEESVKIYNATRVNLNLHSSIQSRELVTGGDFVNPRTFELAAIGAFQLVDGRSLMPELFDEGELATFDSMDDMLAKLDRFLAEPEARAVYVRRARERVLRDHTYDIRMRTLIEFVAERREGWPEQRAGRGLPEGLPENLRGELAGLLERLDVPADSSFDDIIKALRSRQGRLTDIETALLFLDEWRKQYNAG